MFSSRRRRGKVKFCFIDTHCFAPRWNLHKSHSTRWNCTILGLQVRPVAVLHFIGNAYSYRTFPLYNNDDNYVIEVCSRARVRAAAPPKKITIKCAPYNALSRTSPVSIKPYERSFQPASTSLIPSGTHTHMRPWNTLALFMLLPCPSCTKNAVACLP